MFFFAAISLCESFESRHVSLKQLLLSGINSSQSVLASIHPTRAPRSLAPTLLLPASPTTCLPFRTSPLTRGDMRLLFGPAGNKIDLAEKREVLRQRAEDFAEAQSMLYLETSAKESDNVEKLFLDLACELIKEAKQNKLDNSDTAPMPGEGKTISYLSCCSIN